MTALLPIGELPARTAPRLAVLAYDIGHPRRARRVRALLESVHHDRQYSVFEVRLGGAALRGLLAEAAALCNLDEDRLALWWPHEERRLDWTARPRSGHGAATRGAVPDGGTNFVVCYDVSDPEALRRVGGRVAAQGAMVQRSVYWLRLPHARLQALMQACAAELQAGDRLWAYPLRAAGALWQVGVQEASLLPISIHHWREGGS